MKLAFSGQARYPDLDEGYDLYLKRTKSQPLEKKEYNRVVKAYCRRLAEYMKEEGMVDLPGKMGMLSSAILTRKPQYRGEKFVGYGKMDWTKGHFDGNLKAFGVVFLPRHEKNNNMRSFGFVCNRRLFKDIKEKYLAGDWSPLEFTEDMI